jgi:predicted small lipoprotein YifL
MIHQRLLVSLLLCLFLLVACGQKGPLYLPGDPNEIRSEVPATDSEATDEDDEDEDPQP